MKKNNENSKVLKSGIWYTISNFIVKGIAFITMPIFTRIMSTDDVGMFSNLIAWFNIIAIIATFELYSSVSIARFDYKNDLNKYISSNLFFGSLITLIFYIIVLVFYDFFTKLMMIDFKTLNIMFIYLLVYPAIQMFQIKNQIKYNYKSIVFVTLSNALISSIASILLTLIFVNKLDGRIIGYFAPMIIISLGIYIYLMFEGKSINKKYWHYALKISFPLIWHLLAGYLLSSADKIMITKMVSSHANALYSVAYTISQVIAILWMSMNNAWSPWAYEKMENKEYNVLFKNSKPYLIFFLIIVFAFMLVAPELLLIMGGKEYLETKYLIPPVMVGYVFQFVYSLYVNIEFYHKKQKNIAFGTMIACVINIILNYLLIPKFGYIAAAYTTLIGYISLYVIHYIFVKKLGCTYWYDNRFFLKMLIISLFSLLVSNLLYKFNIIRYCLIVLIAIGFIIFCVRKRDKLRTALKNKSLKGIKDIIFSY